MKKCKFKYKCSSCGNEYNRPIKHHSGMKQCPKCGYTSGGTGNILKLL